jgi:hypothetical protein
MAKPDWAHAEEILFEQTRQILRRFATDHPEEFCSFMLYTVDADYAGVGINLDTPANSMRRAQAHQRHQIQYRNEIFAEDRGWETARHAVAHPTNRIEDWNHSDPFKYELLEFVPLPAWEKYAQAEPEGEELEGRVIVSLWRVVERLVEAGAFEPLRRTPPFRIGFAFHDDEMIVLRILDWPDAGPKTGPHRETRA